MRLDFLLILQKKPLIPQRSVLFCFNYYFTILENNGKIKIMKIEDNPLLNYLKNNLHTEENRIVLCYDEISKTFDCNDKIIDMAIAILEAEQIVRYYDRFAKRQFRLYGY